LTALQPFAATRGTSIEVKLVGQDLDELTSLRFSDSRITAKAKAGAADTFVVTVPADVPPGVCDVRAVGRYGVSNPRAFVVETLAVVSGKAGNTSAATAAPAAVGQVICGSADANAVQYYKVPLKKGQRVLVDVDGRSVDSKIEPSAVLADPAGRDVVISRRGELIDFIAHADGEHVLRVFDSTYRGGAEFFYRLAIHSGQHIDFVSPASGLPGTKSKYTLYGRNLPGGSPAPEFTTAAGKPLERLEVDIELPADPEKAAERFDYVSSVEALLDGFDYRLTTPTGVSNPVRIAYATAPVVAETPAATDRSNAAGQKVTAPCEVSGRFDVHARPHAFSFDAAAGAVYWVEVFCNREGGAAAPFVLIQKLKKDAKAGDSWVDVQEVYESPANVGGGELRTSSRDPAYRLEAKEAGTYRAVVRNLFSTPAEVGGIGYRLAIRKEAPDFRMAVVPASPAAEKDSKEVPVWTPLLRRGGVAPLKVVALRRDGFDGEIEVKVEGLPAGVTCSPVKLGKGESTAALLLVASDKAEAGAAAVRVTGTATVAGAAVTRVARAGTVATSEYNKTDKIAEVSSRRAREMVVGVAPEDSPLVIAPAKDGSVETCVFNKVTVPLKVTKRGDFSGAIPLKITGHPSLEKAKEINVDKGDSANVEIDLAALKLPAGTYNLYVETLAKVKYRQNVEAAKLAEDASKAADKKAAETAAAAKAADAKLAATKDAKEKPSLEKAAKEMAAKVKEAEAAKTAAAAKLKEMNAKAAAKETAASFYSTPIRLTVTAAPVTVAPVTANVAVGGKAEADVAVTRLYGFADPIELTLVAPPGVKGLAGKATLAKDQAAGKLAITADAATPAGEHAVKVQAAMKVNGQAVTVEQAMTVKVTAKTAEPTPSPKPATPAPKTDKPAAAPPPAPKTDKPPTPPAAKPEKPAKK
jgi:hypothetical protein